MAHDVFISYSQMDKLTADSLCGTLESHRIRCWIAPRDILPGRRFEEAIIEAISEAKIMVMILSNHSNASPHVINEVGNAVKRGVAIIPFRIENVAFSRPLEYYLGSHHWIDALTPPLENHLNALTEAIKQLIAIKQVEVDNFLYNSKISSLSNLKDRLPDLEISLKNRIVGQDQAIEVLIQKLVIAAFGIKEPDKPLGVLFFAGPHGTGKIEIARALVEVMGEPPDSLLIFGMAEFSNAVSIYHLIGPQQGYVGHDDGGLLNSKRLDRTFSIIIFDEIEKAHHKIFDILLHIFDHGKITDSKGCEVSFKNCIIILTSGVGVYEAEKAIDNASRHRAYRQAIEKVFPPEIMARVTDLVVFNRLTRDNCAQIIDLMFQEIKQQYNLKFNIELTITQKVKFAMLDRGYNPNFGARSIKTMVNNNIRSLIAMELAYNKIKNGNKVEIDINKDNEIIVKKY